MNQKSYFDKTINSKDLLRRWAHRSRVKNSLASIDMTSETRLLDYGCGDGFFLNSLRNANASHKLSTLISYEPYMDSLSANKVKIEKDWDVIGSIYSSDGLFDYVTCFEVFEHFSPSRQIDALANIRDVITEQATVVISVPIEIGFPALVKNVIRKISFRKDKTYTLTNILKSCVGLPLRHLRNGDRYLNHMGFYFKDLESLMAEKYSIEKKFFSPINLFGRSLNSQVFYELKPRQTIPQK